jgi:hypothetical protein
MEFKFSEILMAWDVVHLKLFVWMTFRGLEPVSMIIRLKFTTFMYCGAMG